VNRVNVSNTTVTNITITNVYDNSHNNNIRYAYANKTAPGGVTTVSHGTFVNAQPVHRAVVAVKEREITSAPISRRAEVVPTRSSVLGTSAQGDRRVGRPSAEIERRSVVAKTTPPPPAVPFERQRQKLEAQPGQPLARSEIDGLRPANVPPRRSNVTQAPRGASSADSNQPGNQPASGREARADRRDEANRGRSVSAPPSNPAPPEGDRNPRAQEAPTPRADEPSAPKRREPAAKPAGSPEASTQPDAKRRQKEPPPEQGTDEKRQKKQN